MFPLAAVAFLLSGFAALTYQIVWQRLLVLPVGADVYSTTIVVAAFMAGLGVGSMAGGRIADRLSWTGAIVLFAAAELSVAAFGVASRTIFYDWMHLQLGSVALSQQSMAALVFMSLLWPTFWMGVSLPVLSRAVTHTIAGAARRVGLMYGLNTIGAAAGAFVTTWVLFPRVGFERCLHIAAALNIGAALVVLPAVLLARRRFSDNTTGEPAPVETSGAPTWGLGAWMALYGLAGFQALSLEIIWFRLLGVMMKASAFTFGTLLTIFLSGLGAGAALGSGLVGNVRNPGRAFLYLQAFVGLYAGISVLALVTLLPSWKGAESLHSYLAGYEPLNAASAFAALVAAGGDSAAARDFLRLYVWIPIIIVGPPTVAMGASFPLVQKIVLVRATQIGSRVGLVLLANIAGSTLGSIVTGWFALTHLGSAASLKALTALGGGFLVAGMFAQATSRRTWKVAASLSAASLLALLTFQLPDGRRLWATLHGAESRHTLHAEDATGLSVLKATGNGATVFVNGIGQSWIPYGNVHTALGALPAFVHPHPRRALIIGLGSGDTVYALAGRAELSRVTCVEIIRPQLETLKAWEQRTRDPGLSGLLEHPRIDHVAGDGRSYLIRSKQRFDIIEADALRPASAYSGNLYSVGYFSLVRSRLAPGGIAVTWVPTPRVADTFEAVFPHVLHFGDIALGSEETIPFDADAINRRLQQPAVQAYYLRAGILIDQLLGRYLAPPGPRRIDAVSPRRKTDLNETLFPRDEFSVPRSAH
jgi:predicted membrane-bound spermidine synthase